MAPGRTSPEPRSFIQKGLTQEQVATFERDGYLIIPGALDQNTVSLLLGEAHSLLENFSLDDHPMTKFTTGESKDVEHVGDEYFLDSGDKIRFFFEEDAFNSVGELIKPKSQAINKIGHYLHKLSPAFASLLSDSASHSPGAIARSLGFRDPRCLQSMVICKQPEIGGAVPPHQDSTFLYTDPPSAVGFWYALEDATLENGCLSFLLGSHRTTGIAKRFVRKQNGHGTEFIDNKGPRFPAETTHAVKDNTDDYVPAEVSAGTLVLIHGNLLHKSEKNISQKGRIIYTFHVIDGQGPIYDQKNWLQPPKDGFTKI